MTSGAIHAARTAELPQTGATGQASFPATADQVRQARRFLAAQVSDFPAADDALLCLSELASNSVMHSRSAQSGGHFTVRATRHMDVLRVEVQDDGGHWPCPMTGHEQGGRGLAIVAALARWGVINERSGHRIVWFEISAGDPLYDPGSP